MHYNADFTPAEPLKRTQLHVDLLQGAGLWKCLPGPELNSVAELAQCLLGSDMSAFSVLDRDWQWLTAKCGLEGDQLPREHRFCGRVVDDNQAVVLPDTSLDPDYRDNPMVTGAPYIRAYAGVPAVIHDEDGTEIVIGTLCVVYHEPHAFNADDLAQLHKLAAIAAALVSSRLAALELADLATTRRNDLNRLARMHRQLGQAERMAGIGSWRYDFTEEIMHWSDHVYAIHDLPHGKEPGFEEAMSFYPGRSRALLVDAVALAIEQGRSYDEELDFVSALGTAKRVRTMAEVELQDDQPVALIGVFQDVTRRYEMEQALRRSAETDALTGLTNRGGFNRLLSASIADAREDGSPLALLLIDLDGFKGVNDRCGHLKGDQVLQTIAGALQAPYLADYTCARLGGDEFAVIVRDVAADRLSALVAQLLGDLRHSVSISDGHEFQVSGTIGISWFDVGLDERDMLRRADIALYHGKRTQRGTAATYSPALGNAMCKP